MTDQRVPDVDEAELDEAVIDLRQASFGRGTRIKVQLKKAKDLAQIKIDRFKVGKAYRVVAEPETAFFINAIGYHPVSALPAGFGFLCTDEEFKPMYFCLHELGGEVFF